jgi:hypothetical protein
VLEELALKDRTDEQARFRAELADAVRSFRQTEDLSRLEWVVESWYRHAIMLRYAPGWADKLDRLRRGESGTDQRGPFTLQEALEDLGLPNPEWAPQVRGAPLLRAWALARPGRRSPTRAPKNCWSATGSTSERV